MLITIIKNLKKAQIKDLKEIDIELSELLTKEAEVFESRNFDDLNKPSKRKESIIKECFFINRESSCKN